MKRILNLVNLTAPLTSRQFISRRSYCGSSWECHDLEEATKKLDELKNIVFP